MYNILFERFIKELLSNKVKLKFFSAERETTDDLHFFIPKMEMEYCRHIRWMAEHCEPNNGHTDGDQIHSVPRAIELNLIAAIKKLCPKNAVQINYYLHAQEIAKYANMHSANVLAIISNDLQLLLFEGSYQFWYANHIDLSTLNASLFCRKTLEKSIALNTKQLQLLSVLIASPFLPAKIAENIVSNIKMQSTNEIVRLAHFVRQKSHPTLDLEQIANDIFYPNVSDEDVNAIENGLNCYDINFSVATPNNNPFTTFSKQCNPFIYTLMVTDVYLNKDIAFVDYRSDQTKSFPDLAVPLLQKMMGILFEKSFIKPLDRKICMKFAHDEPHRVIRIRVIYPKSK